MACPGGYVREALPYQKTQTPSEYLRYFKRICAFNGWNDDRSLDYFRLNLGHAEIWFNTWEERLRNRGTNITWILVQRAFKLAFQVPSEAYKWEVALRDRKQSREESVEDYAYDILHLCFLIHPDMDIAEKVRFLTRNMLPEYIDKINAMDPKTPGEIINLLRKCKETEFITALKEAGEVPAEDQQLKAIVATKRKFKYCFKCIRIGHDTDKCRAHITCFNCGRQGHRRKFCRRAKPAPTNLIDWNQNH